LREESGWRGAFPCPAGGMNLNRLPEMISVYGKETVLLIGGALMQDKRGIEKSTSDFMERIRSIGKLYISEAVCSIGIELLISSSRYQ
jgi:ribulose-bisphosphate carboxylase large chain